MARILFVTPVLPCTRGTGSAIRAGIALEILAEQHEVIVVHVDMWLRHEVMDEAFVRSHAVEYRRLPNPVTPTALSELVEQLSHRAIDSVYVFRLAAAPLALQVAGMLAQRPILRALDLDDDEATRPESFIRLYEAAGNHARAHRERAELARLRRFQEIVALRFDTSLVAAPEDLASLRARFPAKDLRLLPNVARLRPETPFSPLARSGLLFLGTLDYVPNEDAVRYFCASILPLLQQADPDAALRVVGTSAPPSIIELRSVQGVTVVGAVRDVAPEYLRTRVLVVPLRAGSGTRIKILEAFSFGTPVVSTSIGAAGLDVRHETHLLIADTPEEFAAACHRLLVDDELAATLTRNASAWLRETHSLDRVREVLSLLFPQRDR